MPIDKMKLITVLGPLQRLDAVSRICVNAGSFHPEPVSSGAADITDFVPFSEPNPYSEALKRLDEYASRLGLQPSFGEYRPGFNFKALLEELERRTEQFKTISAQKDEYQKAVAEDEQIQKQLITLLNVNVKLEQLFNLEFVKFRFGHIPRQSYEHLKRYMETHDDAFIYLPSEIREDFVWGMYLTPRANEEYVDSIFHSMQFERVRISERASGTPRQAYEAMFSEQTDLREKLAAAQRELDTLRAESERFINDAYACLKTEHDIFELRRYAVHSNVNFLLSGWVPANEAPSFVRHFDSLGDISSILENPEETGLKPPTRLKNARLFRPFEQLVCMYGTPSYYELDPTPFVAISYTLLYGLMFGDLGQGAVLSILGLVLWKLRGSNLGRIITLLGISSMLFGVFYGSVFGREDIIHGFNPLEQIGVTLAASVGLGALLITIAMALNIVNAARTKNIERALFSSNGLAGFIFYWGVLISVIFLFGFNINLFSWWYILPLIALPLVLIFLKSPIARLAKGKRLEGFKFGEYAMENGFELFEVLLSFFANTLSFIRIGAFALNHAGFMLAVLAIGNIVGGTGSVLVFIVGNAIVICLEGFIVAMQVMRLQFYELFSRYFTGDGRRFEPVTVTRR